MSMNDLVYQLAQAGTEGDRSALERTMNLLVNEARHEGRHSQARRLLELTRDAKPQRAPRVPRARGVPDAVQNFLVERRATRALDDLVLPADVMEDVSEFLDEQRHAALLRANSVEPRHVLLLVGPPGNGKTSLAEVLASELGLPFLVVNHDAVVDSFLGETASRLRQVIDHAASAPCVLFFDEFDAIGKDRGDIHETGEIKRVVSSLLVQIESIPSHSVVVCATNHPELLDRAAWRRFELRIMIPKPGSAEIAEMFRRLGLMVGDTGLAEHEFIRRMAGKSLAEIEQFNLDVRRKLLLSKGELTADRAVCAVLDRWARQSGPDANPTERNGEVPDSAVPPRERRGKSHPRKKTSALPQEARLPGTE